MAFEAVDDISNEDSGSRDQQKSRFYGVLHRDPVDLVTTQCPRLHRQVRHAVETAYTAKSIRLLEPQLDQATIRLIQKLDTCDGDVVDLAKLLQWFTMGESHQETRPLIHQRDNRCLERDDLLRQLANTGAARSEKDVAPTSPVLPMRSLDRICSLDCAAARRRCGRVDRAQYPQYGIRENHTREDDQTSEALRCP